jgi:hypothetical protein
LNWERPLRVMNLARTKVEKAPMSIRNWAKRARKGEALQYHTGLLMRDRQRDAIANVIASAIWDLHNQGEVLLVQHRSGEADYEYLAIRT